MITGFVTFSSHVFLCLRWRSDCPNSPLVTAVPSPKSNFFILKLSMKKTILTLSAIAASSLVVSAQAPVFSNNFSIGYTNGDLIGPVGTLSNAVGQNGWAQTGAFASGTPITIASGQAVLPSGSTGQDGWKAFDTVVNTTTPGDYLVTTINFTLTNAPSAAGDYFFHLSSPAGTTSVFFQRLFARSAAGGFQLGISGGSAAAGAAFGSTLSLNTSYEAVIKWDFVSGALNDLLTLYIDPSDPILTNNTVYSSTNFLTAEPTTVAAANLRIGGALTTPGVLVDSIQVIPEPSTYAMLALAGAGFAGYVIRRRRR